MHYPLNACFNIKSEILPRVTSPSIIPFFQGGASFVDPFCYFIIRVCHAFLSVLCSLVVTCLLALCDVFCVFVTFP